MLIGVESKITGTIAELDKHRETLSTIQAQITRTTADLALQDAKLAGINAQISETKEQIAPLYQEKLDLEGDVILLRKRKDNLELDIAARQDDYAKQQAHAERTLTGLQADSRAVALDIQRDEAQWKQVREDLALRETKLNEREEILSNRELKVNRDEKMLARNHDLLGL